MENLSIEEKAKRYDEAIKVANKYKDTHIMFPQIKDEIFPELKESEDEKIRKMLIQHIRQERGSLSNDEAGKCIEWLEKQGEQMPFDYENATIVQKDFASKVEPKFHKGEWVVLSTSDGEKVVQIDSIEYFKSGEPRYITSEGKWFGNGTKAHLWTIKDAKDGDVLVSGQVTILFKKFEEDSVYNFVIAYAGIDITGKIQITNEHWLISNKAKPATKEQRDLLFQKMTESGYKWDAEKKELKKIDIQELVEQKPAWSEEDNMMFNSIADNLQREGVLEKKRKMDWLKSLRSQNRWKPSDEQIKAFEHFVRSIGESGYDNNTKLLYSLLSDLKKLKEK